MSDFKVVSEKEIQEANLFEPGVYPFDCINAERWVSKEGKISLKIELQVFVGSGKKYVAAYLSGNPKIAYKLRHFCDSLGILDAYETGDFTEIARVAPSKSGMGKFGIDEGDGSFPAKNVAQDFIKRENFNKYGVTGAEKPVVKQETPFDLDDIPY